MNEIFKYIQSDYYRYTGVNFGNKQTNINNKYNIKL